MFHVVEVIETKKAFKPGQVDDEGKPLFNGSILVKIGSADSIVGQVKNIWCAPATFNKRIPFIGEQVLMFEASSTEQSATDFKSKRYFYFAPYNTVNNVSNHHFPLFFKREKSTGPYGSQPSAEILADKKELGYTVSSRSFKSTKMLQPYEGDDIWEGRFAQSIRFTHTYRLANSPGPQIYQQNSLTNWPGRSEFDPLTIIRVKFPSAGSGYDLEDLASDQSSIYLTTAHKLLRFKAGSNTNCAVKGIPNWQGAQVLIDSDRIVLNAKNDDAFLIAKKRAIITAKKIQFQTEKHTVDLDTLMNWLKKFVDNFDDLVAGTAPLTTAMGPSGPGKSAPQVKKLATVDYKTRFKQKGCNPNRPNDDSDSIANDAANDLAGAAAAAGPTGPVSAAIAGASGGGGGGGGGAGGEGGGGGDSAAPAAPAAGNDSPGLLQQIGNAITNFFGGGNPPAAPPAPGPTSNKKFTPKKGDQYINKRDKYMKNKKCKNLTQAGKDKGFLHTEDIAGGLPTKNNRKYTHPIGVDFGEKIAPILRKHNLWITDTNDWRDETGKGHKSQDQSHGLSVDANFPDKKYDAQRLGAVVQDANKAGLNFVYEVNSPEEEARLIRENPVLKGHVKYIGRKTAPHFSVYYAC